VITEKEAILATPPSGWVHDYLKFALRQTTAPAGYHLANALSMLAVTTPSSYGTSYAGDLYGNLYVLIVGRSGDDQKSSAMGIAKKVLYAVQEQLGIPLVGKQPGSTEGLVDSLVIQPRQVIHYSEFGAFLSKAQKKGSYFEPMKAYYTDLWDCQPIDRLKANNVVISQPNPRLSLSAGVSLPFLEQHTEAHDWTGGFMGRWAVIYSRRERTNPYPRNDWSAIPDLAARLLTRAQMEQAGVCWGLDNVAYKKWEDWFYDLDARPVPEIISGAKTRIPTIAMKAALLYAWDFGEPMQGEPWYINENHLDWGIKFAELHLKSIVGLAKFLAEHADAQLRRSILEVIPDGGCKSLSQILRSTKMKKRTVLEVLDGLVVDGTLRIHAVSGGAGETIYERIKEMEWTE